MASAQPYRPSNGTEGECFMGRWCAGCARDAYGDASFAPGEGEQCEILANAMAGAQPPEWIADDRGPRCTAFVDDGTPIFDPNAAIGLLL